MTEININNWEDHAPDLEGANFAGEDLRDIRWTAIDENNDMINVNLKNANLEGANLSMKWLKDFNLEGANLKNTNLTGANLEGANLSGANLQNANLKNANLKNANLKNANLKIPRYQWIMIEEEQALTLDEGCTVSHSFINEYAVNDGGIMIYFDFDNHVVKSILNEFSEVEEIYDANLRTVHLNDGVYLDINIKDLTGIDYDTISVAKFMGNEIPHVLRPVYDWVKTNKWFNKNYYYIIIKKRSVFISTEKDIDRMVMFVARWKLNNLYDLEYEEVPKYGGFGEESGFEFSKKDFNEHVLRIMKDFIDGKFWDDVVIFHVLCVLMYDLNDYLEDKIMVSKTMVRGPRQNLDEGVYSYGLSHDIFVEFFGDDKILKKLTKEILRVFENKDDIILRVKDIMENIDHINLYDLIQLGFYSVSGMGSDFHLKNKTWKDYFDGHTDDYWDFEIIKNVKLSFIKVISKLTNEEKLNVYSYFLVEKEIISFSMIFQKGSGVLHEYTVREEKAKDLLKLSEFLSSKYYFGAPPGMEVFEFSFKNIDEFEEKLQIEINELKKEPDKINISEFYSDEQWAKKLKQWEI